ncbi:DNA mismatch repair protein MutS [Candidatus Fermentibacteria bacterium]|nr:MAG: DNA mismatch repair protein MutS [Candidatus Fermentibacteria bacterium]
MADAMNTPMMRQYMEMKREHPDAVLLFRMGDFYETFLDDAKKISGILGITLTSRQKSGGGEGIPLAGFPHHALDGYLTRLLKAGLRVAVCEQTEDPKKAKGLVKREVVEIVTPGTLVAGSALEQRTEVLLGAYAHHGNRAGMVFCDLSTGDITATEVDSASGTSELARMNPREVLVSEELDAVLPPDIETTTLDSWKFDPGTGEKEVSHVFGSAAPEGFGISDRTAVLSAFGALLSYIGHTKCGSVSHLNFRGLYMQSDSLLIDRNSSRALGITDSIPGEEEAVLAERTDETVTPGGGRLWRRWLTAPPFNPEETAGRHQAVEHLLNTGNHLKIRELLRGTADLERQAGKLGTRRASPRDLRAISATAEVIPKIFQMAAESGSLYLERTVDTDRLEDIAAIIDSAVSLNPPVRLTDGGVIREGYSSELDQLREVKTGGRKWMESMLAAEQEATGIQKMNLGYNRVFGYYIEVTKANLHLVPEHYIRKQTLVGGERFITPDLKEMEQKILGADERIAALEAELYSEILEQVAQSVDRVRNAGRALSVTDVICSLAYIAQSRGWTKPVLSESRCLKITDGRHPVLEAMLPAGECVPNSMELTAENRILLVTGPNMAGKSTFLRQAALLVILAQSGSFVPAAKMEFSPVDRIYTRIGSADRLTRGQSTFLVEMAEAASLLNGSTGRSLAILDEIGRGTSTYDGLSIAWAMLEYLHDSQEHCPLVVFATHYHELTSLASRLPMCSNANTVVRETGRKISFLYQVEPGSADRSYGIHVASMAGVPSPVVKRAGRVLEDLEKGRHLLPSGSAFSEGQMSLPLSNPEHPVLEEIRRMEPDALTPRKALELIYALKDRLD